MSIRRAKPVVLAAIIVMSSPASAWEDPHPGWTRSGNLLQIGIPLTALGLTFVFGSDDAHDARSLFEADSARDSDALGLNWPGPRLGHTPRVDLAIALARTEVVTYALKYTIDARRPNGGSHGFPSGHSSAAFMGAEFIREHDGPYWGVPAYAAATWVGYTRVESHNHYWRDVIAGAAIGIAANHDFDHLETRVGTFSIAPTLLAIEPVDTWPEWSVECLAACASPVAGPGLMVRLDFKAGR